MANHLRRARAAKTLINEFYPIISVDFCLLDSDFFSELCALAPVVVERSGLEVGSSGFLVAVNRLVVMEGMGLQLVGVESRRVAVEGIGLQLVGMESR
ncbi:hypothetical protein AKJ16_DCAP10009 [Drosera capensis]